MAAIAAVLSYQQPQLVQNMVEQLGNRRTIIIDNGSNPPVNVNCPIIRKQVNGYFTGGWNFAMNYMKGYDYIWMCNSDIENVSQQQLDQLIEIAAGLGPKFAILSPAFNSPHPHMQNQGNGTREVRWIDWCAPLVSTRWWSIVGGFDPQFDGYGADLDWCKRAFRLGAQFYVTDQVSFNHLGSVTAINEGLQGIQGNVEVMNNLLKAKYGVSDWSKMF